MRPCGQKKRLAAMDNDNWARRTVERLLEKLMRLIARGVEL